MTVERLVVVGASLAGLRAIEAARKSGYRGRITLVGAEPHVPYDRPPLSKAYLDPLERGVEPTDPTFRPETYLRDELDVELVLGEPATDLDSQRKIVVVGTGTRTVDYDALIIATGAEPVQLPNTSHLQGIICLRSIEDAKKVRHALDEGARVVIVGAGFIGSELASGARKRGLNPVIVEALPTPLTRAVGAVMGATLAKLHDQNGTELRCGTSVTGVYGRRQVESIALDDGSEIPADLVVVGIGTKPATSWLSGSGLTIDNGVVCDDALYTGVDGIYAAGDVANWRNPMFNQQMRLEHWTSAAEQGARAATNALNPIASKPYSTVPYFWSDWYDARIQFVGTPQADEVVIVDGNLDSDNRLVALYRKDSKLVGALTVNGQTEIMKYRGLITKQASWQDAVGFAKTRATRKRTNSATCS